MTDTTAPAPDRLKTVTRQAVKGTVWYYLAYLLGKGLTFVSTVILARLLAPEQFGLVATAGVLIQYLDVLTGLGLNSALIAQREKIEEASNIAFWASVVNGAFFWLLAWLGAPWVAAFFAQPDVAPMFVALGSTFFLGSFAVTPAALLERNLEFKRKLVPDLTRNVVKGLTSIGLALTGTGAWSLVWGQVAGEVATTLVLLVMARWRPTWKFDGAVSRKMLAYGGNMMAVSIVGVIRNDVDYLIVGRLLGPLALGFYTQAYRLPEMLIRSLNLVIGNVAFPALAQLQADFSELRQLYRNYVRFISLFTFPAGVGLALTAPAFIYLFFTEKWAPAIVPMALIALAIAVNSVGFVPGVLYKAISRPDILNRLALIKLPFTLGGLLFATQWGIIGVAVGQLGLAVFYTVLESVVVSRLVKFTVRDMVQALLPSAAGAGVMGFVLWLLTLGLDPQAWYTLPVMVPVGAAVYALTLRRLAPDLFAQALRIVRSLMGRKKAPKTS